MPSKWSKKELIEAIGESFSKGKSLEAVAVDLGVTPRRLKDLCSRDDDIQEAVELGFAQSQAYWENLGLKLAAGVLKDGKQGVWTAVMKSRFNYSDNAFGSGDGESVNFEGEATVPAPVTEMAEWKKRYEKN